MIIGLPGGRGSKRTLGGDEGLGSRGVQGGGKLRGSADEGSGIVLLDIQATDYLQQALLFIQNDGATIHLGQKGR
jgi:hypothetical protein